MPLGPPIRPIAPTAEISSSSASRSSAPAMAAAASLHALSASARSRDSRVPSDETLRRRLLRGGVAPAPKILHTLRKKETLKLLRRQKKQQQQQPEGAPAVDPHETHFRAALSEFRALPWMSSGKVDLRRFLGDSSVTGGAEEGLGELKNMFTRREEERLRWLLDNDLEDDRPQDESALSASRSSRRRVEEMEDKEKIELLAKRLGSVEMNLQDWRFTRLMRQAKLIYDEENLLMLLDRLRELGLWRPALFVVEWVYAQKDYMHQRSRFVYTKLLDVLGKARRPAEALHIFSIMQKDAQIYPDLAAYHSISVTLGQAGYVKELIKIVESMRQMPSKRNMSRDKTWDPTLDPDLVIYNAVINACVASKQWRGPFWVFKQMRNAQIKPNGASYGLAMEAMLHAGKYEFVHKFFQKMQEKGHPPKAKTYRVLVKTLWNEGKVSEAVNAVKDMERRGVVGDPTVYYELACCLCNNGRWQDAILQIDKLKTLPLRKSLEVTFTGMILASFRGGHVNDCVLIFESMKGYCAPNIGAINAMLKVYGHLDLFAEAKALYETTNRISLETCNEGNFRRADKYTYSSMLEIAASAQQWEYFDYVYREMILSETIEDLGKFSSLLVKASIAGKWLLLEHAFDTILERGQIPSLPMFTEMICQTLAQNKFERTVKLLNGMAYAKFRMDDTQWINLVQKNMNRFMGNTLKDLLNYMGTCVLVREEPVLGFMRSLESLCTGKLLKCSSVNERSAADADRRALCTEPSSSKNSEQACALERSCETSTGKIPDACSEDIRIKRKNFFKLDPETSIVDEVLDSLTADSVSCFAGLPSAAEILETWQNERLKT